MKALANEIKIMKNLNSQYCLKLFEFHETANSIYFVVEVIEGGQLLNKVRKEGEFTSNELKEILKNMISALSYMHLKHIMHRDLKPKNFMLGVSISTLTSYQLISDQRLLGTNPICYLKDVEPEYLWPQKYYFMMRTIRCMNVLVIYFRLEFFFTCF